MSTILSLAFITCAALSAYAQTDTAPKFCDGYVGWDTPNGKITNFWQLVMHDRNGNTVACVKADGKVEISQTIANVCPRTKLAANMRATVKHSKKALAYINSCSAKLSERQTMNEVSKQDILVPEFGASGRWYFTFNLQTTSVLILLPADDAYYNIQDVDHVGYGQIVRINRRFVDESLTIIRKQKGSPKAAKLSQ